MKKHCYICYSDNTDDDFICDTCNEYYCEDCSYTFSLHYQHQGTRCYFCADQRRRKELDKSIIRENKIKLFLNYQKNLLT